MIGSDGIDFCTNHVLHIQFRRFSCDDIVVYPRLTGHFIGKGNTLGFCSDDNIEGGNLFQKSRRRSFGNFHIAKHNKSADIKVIVNFT